MSINLRRIPVTWCYTALCQPCLSGMLSAVTGTTRSPEVPMKLWDKFRSASCACVAALLLLYAAPVGAQDASADPPAHISVVDGTVSLEREGRPETAPASMPLLAGDRLRTENGRVEVMFGDGSTLHLDTYSTVDFQSDEVIRLMEGRVRLTIPGPPRRVSYRIDAASGWAQIQEPGEYRVAVTRSSRESQTGDVELVVLRGSAELMNEDGQTTLRAGERAFARAGAAPSYAYVYNSAGWDAFDRWSDARRADRAGISAQYLPETVRSVLLDVRSVRLLAARHVVRLRVVSEGQRWMAALLLWPMGQLPVVWLDLGRHRSVVLADSPLRPMGLLGRRLVLDSRTDVGPRVGLVGVRTRLRELVPARMGQSGGLSVRPRRLLRRSVRLVACLDGRPAPAIRLRLREHHLCWRDADRCAHPGQLRGAANSPGVPRHCGSAKPGTYLCGRHAASRRRRCRRRTVRRSGTRRRAVQGRSARRAGRASRDAGTRCRQLRRRRRRSSRLPQSSSIVGLRRRRISTSRESAARSGRRDRSDGSAARARFLALGRCG